MLHILVVAVLIQRLLASGPEDYYDKDFCIGKTDGLHADPEDCRAYYDCVKNRARHRTGLSTGIMFDPQTKTFGRSEDVNCTVQKVYRELWTGVPGAEVADLESSPSYPCAPHRAEFIDTFCIYKLDIGNSFGQRLRSFFRAPETGNYIFQTSCDNTCQLWMSDNELPSRKRLIVDQKHYTSVYSFDLRLDQSSEKVNLTKGNLYYMELLHKENTLIDFMCVGAMFPTLSRERPISSRHLVMESTELGLIGCTGNGSSLEFATCTAQNCKSPQQKLESFKRAMDEQIKSLKSLQSGESSSSQRHISQVTKESGKIINGIMEDPERGGWQNSTLAIQIARVTESFGRELAQIWSNESSSVTLLESSIALQASVLVDDYKFSAPRSRKVWQGIDDFLSLRITGTPKKTKAFSVIYKRLHEMIPSTVKEVSKENEKERGLYHLNSRIIGSLITASGKNQKLDVEINVQHIKHESNSTLVPVCAWWDFTAGGGNESGLWSTRGCKLDDSASNGTHSVCRCNHLTNFAILMKVKSDTTEVKDVTFHIITTAYT